MFCCIVIFNIKRKLFEENEKIKCVKSKYSLLSSLNRRRLIEEDINIQQFINLYKQQIEIKQRKIFFVIVENANRELEVIPQIFQMLLTFVN